MKKIEALLAFALAANLACQSFAASPQARQPAGLTDLDVITTGDFAPDFADKGPSPKNVSLFVNFARLPKTLRSIFDNSSDNENYPGRSGDALYRQTPCTERQSFLNVAAKLSSVPDGVGGTIIDHISAIRSFGRTAFTGKTDRRLVELLKDNPLFVKEPKLDDHLHHLNGWTIVANYHTKEKRAPLHVVVLTDGKDYIAQVHVDRFQNGVLHLALEVGYNSVFRRPNRPETVYKLETKQGIRPAYVLVPKALALSNE